MALGLVYFIWGSTYFGIAVAIHTMPPMLMLGTRFGIAGLVVFSWLVATGRNKASAIQWKNAGIAGILLLGVATGTLAWAEQYIPSGLAALIVTISPVWIVTLDWLWKGGPRPNALTWAGIALGILGIVILIDPFQTMGGDEINIPAALGLFGGSIAWGVGSLHGRHADLPNDPFLSTAIQMMLGGLALTVFGLLRGELAVIDVSAFTAASIGAWLYLVVFGSIVAFTAYVWLMRTTSPTLVSTHSFVNPVVAVLLGWAFLNEKLTSTLFLATILLVAGLICISRAGQRRNSRRDNTDLPPDDDSLWPPIASAPGQMRGAGQIVRPSRARRIARSVKAVVRAREAA